MRFPIGSIVLLAACALVTSALAGSGRQGDTKVSQKGHVDLVFVAEGSFKMGGIQMMPGMPKLDPTDDPGAWIRRQGNGGYSDYHNDEGPVHHVYLSGYWIGKNLVTVAEFREFTKATHYRFNWKAIHPEWGWIDTHPMVMVTWADARAYCKWAGGDLPTEAQWEKAARGTDGRDYPWGNQYDASKLWTGQKTTGPVGSFPSGASPYGCLDMAGNTYEWCLDWYSMDYTGLNGPNPTGIENGDQKVIRGGMFAPTSDTEFRVTTRHAADPKAGACVYGFRLVVSQ